jgi:uncharacterized protein YbaR (Trm112 family)
MKEDTLYKHKNTTDVVFNPTYITKGFLGLYIEGQWYSITSGVPKLLSTDVICIKNADLDQWEIYDE